MHAVPLCFRSRLAAGSLLGLKSLSDVTVAPVVPTEFFNTLLAKSTSSDTRLLPRTTRQFSVTFLQTTRFAPTHLPCKIDRHIIAPVFPSVKYFCFSGENFFFCAPHNCRQLPFCTGVKNLSLPRTKVLDRRIPRCYHMAIKISQIHAFEQKPVHTEIPSESCRVVRGSRESRIEFLLRAVHRT